MDLKCRTCMHPVQYETAINVFARNNNEESVADMLKLLAPVAISEDDYLPKTICLNCFENLNVCYDFKKLVMISDFKFKQEIIKLENNSTELGSLKLEKVKQEYENFLFPVNKFDVKNEIDIELNKWNFYSETENLIVNNTCESRDNFQATCNSENDREFVKQETNSTSIYKKTKVIMTGPDAYLSQRRKKRKKLKVEFPRVCPKEIRQPTHVYVCFMCRKEYRQFLQLKLHNFTHLPTVCNYCGKILIRNSDVKGTRIKVNENHEKSYQCSLCRMRFLNVKKIDQHIRMLHQNFYRCLHCDFSRIDRLVGHIQQDTINNRLQCTHCGRKFSKKGNLVAHIRIHTGERPFKCVHCDRKFTIKKNLNSHIRTHTGEKPFQCTYCDRKFSQKDTLTCHIRTHTGEKPYQCAHCQRIFTKKETLVAHIRTHTGEKPFQCNKCVRGFSTKRSLNRHILIHTREKPFPCIHCDSRFSEKGTLIRHIRTHTGEKPFQCTHCDRIFSTKGTLITHIRTHTGEKPYQCNHCDREFTTSSNLIRHVQTHTNDGSSKAADFVLNSR